MGDVLLVTVTAPGVAAGMAWDLDHCRSRGPHRCSGPAGCRVVKPAREWFNETLDSRFSRLHRRAAARTRRSHGPGALLAAKAIEAQARGVNHLHLVLAYGLGPERERADTYVRHLRELAAAEAFGGIDAAHYDGAGGVRAASYCAKYVGKSVTETGVARPAYVGRHLTMETGVTMRALRWRRYLKIRLGVESIHLSEVPFLTALFVGFPGLRVVAPSQGP